MVFTTILRLYPPNQELRTNRRMSDNIVYVGSKPVMSYVMAIITSLNRNPEEVVLKARGRAISNAVDAVEIARNRFLSDLKPSVSIGTEQLEGEEGRTRNVSTIEIILRKSPEAMKPRGREPTTEAG